jgi:two-component system copper resistance phosphate regulon response regulator CusR
VRILVVEDDPVISALIRRALEQAHFEVEVCADGTSGLQSARDPGFGLIVLDVMLPGMDGWTICRTLRDRRITTPILMLTARDSVEDRVRGLEGGADDYLPKPFDFKELLARVRALLRRDKLHKTRVIRVADLEIETTARVVSRGGQEIALTPREYTLLEALVLNEGRVVTREMITDRIWQDDESFSNTVNVHVANLRKKIDANHPVKLIHTIHGVGYTLRSPETETT